MWTEDIAKVWTNYIPPCRPSRFELEVCSNLISDFRNKNRIRPRLLILGSTTEFRELAHEEWCETVIIDNSSEYQSAISNELKYKYPEERLIFENWQQLDLKSQFDLILGDLVIGNLKANEIHTFLEQIKRALRDEGIFFTKSFFYQGALHPPSPTEFFRKYERKFNFMDPFAFNIYNLVTYCVNKTNYMLKFSDMHHEVKSCFLRGVISEKTWNRFSKLGWEQTLKEDFYVMPKKEWEDLVFNTFSSFSIKFGNYFWSKHFPLYVIKK